MSPLGSNSWGTEIWLGGPPNGAVGLGGQVLCLPLIRVTSEVPRGPSTWIETKTADVQLKGSEDHGPALG